MLLQIKKVYLQIKNVAANKKYDMQTKNVAAN